MKKFLLFLLVCWLQLSMSFAQDIKAGQECFPKKNDELLVYDEAQLLTPAQRTQLESKLDQFALSTSNQIVIVIVPDLCGMDKSQFAIELGEAWGVGHAKEDNGVVMLIKPKTPESKGQVFLAIGRGLEGAIPDAKTFLIVDNEMLPRFKNKDMYGGIDAATNVIISLAKGEYNIDAYGKKFKSPKGSLGIGFLVLFVLLFIGVIVAAKAYSVRRYALLNSIPFWTAWALLEAAQQRHRGYYDDFRGGRGGFGGFGGFGGGGNSGGGGGGFGGFGGGSFGGGGSGGSW